MSSPDDARAALDALVAIIGERARDATAIEGELRAVRGAAGREHRDTIEEIDEHAASRTRAQEEAYERELSATAADFADRLRRVTTGSRDRRAALERQATNDFRELERQLKERIWLAETVYEAGEDRPAETFRRTKAGLDRDMEKLAAAESAGLTFLAECHVRPPAPPTDASTEHDDAPPSLAELRERTEDAVKTLRAQRLPRLFAGLTPMTLALLPAAVAGTLASYLNGWSLGQPVFIAAGATLGLTLVVQIAGFIIARKRTRQEWADVARLIFLARRAHERELAEAAALRVTQERALKEERAREIDAAKREIEPRLERIKATVGGDVDSARRSAQDQAHEVETERDSAIASLREEHERAMAEIARERDAATADATAKRDRRIADAERKAEAERDELRRRWIDVTGRSLKTLERISQRTAALAPAWTDASWDAWQPGASYPEAVPFGRIRVDLCRLPDGAGALPDDPAFPFEHDPVVHVPALIGFPTGGSVLLEADPASRDEALDAVRALMLRLLTTFPPGKARFTIIDPVGLGQSFAGFMHLADYEEAIVGARIWTEQRHIEQRLSDLTEHMEDVIQKYLRNEFDTIAAYNEQAGEIAEPYRFLVIADFPANFSDAATRRLASIISSGARCGVFTIIVRDTGQRLPAHLRPVDLFAGGARLVPAPDPDASDEHPAAPSEQPDARHGAFRIDDDVLGRFALTLDAPPTEQRLTSILHRLGEGAVDSTRVRVPFSSISPKQDAEWTRTSAANLRVALGRSGATKLQHLTLGEGVAQHALIAGKTGSGKSTLLHVLITNTALWYSPDEVEFYLVDFKKGVEFKTYAAHDVPHLRVVAIESDREFGLSVLEEVDAELRRRGDLFRRLGVQSIQAYRELPDATPIPRTLLMIDEFQEFFVQDDRVGQDAALLLDRLVRQGRAFGIHVVLGSQTLGGAYSLARATINQMAVRIALQCSESDAYLIMSEDNTAPRLLSRPGEAIYNDAGGLIDGNSPFQVCWLPDAERDRSLDEVERLASARPASVTRPPTIVFEGNEPGELGRNPRVADTVAGVPCAWLGEPIAIKQPTHALMRRESAANLMILGQQEETALGMLLSAFVGLGAQHVGAGAQLVVIDATRPDSSLAGVPERLARAFAHDGASVVPGDSVAPAIERIEAIVADRLENNRTADPPVFLFIAGLHRTRELRRREDDFGMTFGDDDAPASPEKRLRTILREGPPLGVFTLAWCDALDNLERTLDRESIRQFGRRVALQMGANDSSQFIEAPGASTLGVHRAAFLGETGSIEKFRPYAVPDPAYANDLAERIRAAGSVT